MTEAQKEQRRLDLVNKCRSMIEVIDSDILDCIRDHAERFKQAKTPEQVRDVHEDMFSSLLSLNRRRLEYEEVINVNGGAV